MAALFLVWSRLAAAAALVFLLSQEAAAATPPFRLSLHRTTAVPPPVVAILEEQDEEPQRQSRKHKDNNENEEDEELAGGAADDGRYQYGGYYGGYYYNYPPLGNGAATAATATGAPSTVPTRRPTQETSEDATATPTTVAPVAPPLPGDNDQGGATTTTPASPPPTATTPPNNAAGTTLPPGTVQANPPSSSNNTFQSSTTPPKRPTRPPSPFGGTSEDDNDATNNNEEDKEEDSSSSNNDNNGSGNTLPPGFVQANPTNSDENNNNGSVEEDLPQTPPTTPMPTASPAPTPIHDSCRAAQSGQVFTTRVSQSVPMDYEVLYVIDEDSDTTTASNPPQYWAPQLLDEPFRQYLALTLVDCALADASPIQGMDVALASTPLSAESSPCQRIQFFEDTQFACRRMQSTLTVYLSEDISSTANSMTTLEVQDVIYTTLRTAMNGPTYRRRQRQLRRQLFVSDFTNPDEGIMDLYLLNVPSTDSDTPPLNALERDTGNSNAENAKLGQAASASIMGAVFLALGVLGLVWFRRSSNHNNNDQSTIYLHKTTVSSQAQSFDDQDHYQDRGSLLQAPPLSPTTRGRGGPFVLPLHEVRTAHVVPPCTPSQLSVPEGMPATTAADGDHQETMDYPATSLFEAYEASPIHNPHPEVDAEEGEQLFYRTVTTGYPIPPKIRSQTQEIGTVRRKNHPTRRYEGQDDDELVAVPPPFLHASRPSRPADPPADNDNDTSVFSVTGFLNGHCAAMEGFYDPDQDPLLFCCDRRTAAAASSTNTQHYNPKTLLPNDKIQTKKTSPTSAMELEWDASPVRPSHSFHKQHHQQTKSRTSVHLWAQQCGYEHSNDDDDDDDDDYCNSSHKEEEAESQAPTSYFHNFSPYGKEEPEDTSLASSARTMKKTNHHHHHLLSSRSPDPSVRMGNVSTSTHPTSSRRRRQDDAMMNSSSRLAATATTHRRSPHYDRAATVDVEENDEDYYRYHSSSSSSSSEDRYNYTSSSSRSMGPLRSSSRGRPRRQSNGSPTTTTIRGDLRGRPSATAQHPVYALDTIAF